MLKLTADKVRQAANKFREMGKTEPLYMAIHPDQHYKLRVIFAKDKYKHEQWIPRYNKWRASQGLPPYVEVEGEYGSTNGFTFKETA